MEMSVAVVVVVGGENVNITFALYKWYLAARKKKRVQIALAFVHPTP